MGFFGIWRGMGLDGDGMSEGGQDLVLQGGNSGDFGSAGLVLTCLCVPPTIFVWSTTPRESVRMFGVPVRLLSSNRSCVGRLSGGLGCFTVFQCALMDSFASAVVSVLLRLPGASLCLPNASDRLARPSGPASTSDFTSVPSLSSIVVISPPSRHLPGILTYSYGLSTHPST